MSDLLLDTSVFIAAESGRPMRQRPVGEARVSVVTLAELKLGILRATGDVRTVREATLAEASLFLPLAVDERVADELAGLLAKLHSAQRRSKAFDCFLAATALAHQLTVITQDSDYDELQAVEPRLAVQRV
ncbi:MAG: PIN domain-containing protein [Actinomycetota bacterium]|nr:PIN domain-containing protein [Actinomycetota bacterium]